MSYGNHAIGTRGYGGNTGKAATALSVLDKFVRGVDLSNSLLRADTDQVWSSDHGTWGTSGGKAYTSVNDTGGSQGGLATADLGIATQDVSVVLASGPSDGEQFGCLARFSDANNYWIAALYKSIVGGHPTNLYFGKCVAGAFTWIVNGVDMGTVSYPATLEITANGSNLITVLLNGVSKGSTTDAFNSGATRVGIHEYNSVAQRIDTFTATPLAAPTGTTYTVSVSGAASSSGALSLQPQIRKAGAVPIAGTLVRSVSKGFVGVVSSSGGVIFGNLYTISLSGSVTPTGTLTKQPGKVLAGAASSTGSLLKQVAKKLAGAVSSSGSVSNVLPTPPGKFIVGGAGRDFLRKYAILTSDDGVTYTTRSTPLNYSGASERVNCVAATPLAAIAGGGCSNTSSRPRLMRSADGGATWVGLTSPWRDTGSTSDEVFGIWYSPERSLWMAVGICGGTGAPLVATSSDGVTWTECFLDVPTGGTFHTELPKTPRCVIYANGAWWIGGDGGSGSYHTLAKSTNDGATWTSVANQWFENSSAAGRIQCLAWNGSMLIAGGYQGNTARNITIQTSPDGVTWTTRSCGFDRQSGQGIGGMVLGLVWLSSFSLWVATGLNQPASGNVSIATSPDGITWTNRGQPLGGGNGVAWDVGRHRAVAVGQASTNTVTYSDNGTTWTSDGDPTVISGLGDINLYAVVVQAAFVPTASISLAGASTPSGTVSVTRIPSIGSWVEKAEPPTHQNVAGLAGHNAKIYVFGGQNYDTSAYLTTVQCYDVASNTWSSKAPLPTAMRWVRAITVGDDIWLFGETTFTTSQIFIYHPLTNTYSSAPGVVGYMGTLDSTQVAYAPDDAAFWTVATGSGGSADLPYRLDPANLAAGWVQTGPARPTSGSVNPEIVATVGLGRKVYFFGGSTGNPTTVAHAYDTFAHTWTVIAPMMQPRGGGRAAVFNGKIWLAAGYDGSFVNIRSVQIYDPDANTWSVGPYDLANYDVADLAAVNPIFLYRDSSDSGGTRMMFETFVPAPIELISAIEVDVDLYPFPWLQSAIEVDVDFPEDDLTVPHSAKMLVPGFVHTGEDF